MCRETRQAWERGMRTGSGAAHGGCRAAEARTAQAGRARPRVVGAARAGRRAGAGVRWLAADGGGRGRWQKGELGSGGVLWRDGRWGSAGGG
ncbi:hypothetical protein E2562_001198 [Oryza meyeriana var. granulata]|uniref:Uncharacterized protein n=1 Tax=Oryza meyeriana var. granulata TaxID=110450 RepID=A0A6G1DCD0_9ORYZ|nr:hypothetical protein E2562_001198 [Oryza meyeriana var. granulata]